MNELLNKMIDNPINKPVLNFLGISDLSKNRRFESWENTCKFEEGGIALFDKYGKNIPNKCKYSLEIHNVMVIPDTGEIFAFHTGRYSLFLKCDFEYFGLMNSDAYRRGYTFDCIADITELGNDWAFMDNLLDMESEHLERTYQVRQKT